MSTFKRLFAGAVAAGVLAVAGATTQAALVFDVRATSITGPGSSVSTDGKWISLDPRVTGQVISYSVYALVTGTGSGLEAFQSAKGVIATTVGSDDVQINLTHALATPFNGTYSSAGTPTDLGGDSDIDIGTTLTPTNTTSGIIIHRDDSPVTGNSTGISEFLLGTGTATILGFGQEEHYSTVLNFILATPTYFDKQPSWKEDGLTKAVNSAGVSVWVNPGVLIACVPEPGSVSLLGIGAVGLLARRRR